MRQFFALALVLSLSSLACAQTANAQAASARDGKPDLPDRAWHAAWVTHPTAPLREPLVLHFRRDLTLASVPASYIVRVSADNRFVLYVNGKRVGDGPARGDLTHWRYEKFDLAPYLKAGDNRISATVWNFGVLSAIAQFTDRTAFLLESEEEGADGISTPKDWMVEEDAGQGPLPRSTVTIQTYMASGPGEARDAAKYDWNWDAAKMEGGKWVPVASPMRDSIFAGVNHAHSAGTTGDNPWGLVQDTLPHMAYSPVAAGEVVSMDSIGAEQPGLKNFPDSAVTLPAGIHTHLILDRKTLITAYPQLTVSGGKGATIWLTYSEALYDDKEHKGDRDALNYTDAQGTEHPRVALGLRDEFLPDGGDNRTFEPLWWRTWRYLDLDITTGSEPLTLNALKANFSAYPFDVRAKFASTSPSSDSKLSEDLSNIWDVSWRTAQMDAHETYMDTPYYEQLQYVGDTRIQALISYAVTGDDRLPLQALHAFDESRNPEGITRSRYPSSLPQNIPTFSLLYVSMLHDYWMYRPDPAPVKELLPGTRGILHWFNGYEQPDGLLHEVPWWSFIDWVLKGETPTYSKSGESCMTTLEYLGALNDAAQMEKAAGDPMLADRYAKRAEHLRQGIYGGCWNAKRGLLADNPDQQVYSQQANVLAVLYDVIPKAEQKKVMEKIFSIAPGETPDGVMSASYYFRFYFARALEHAGMGDEYLASLAPWRDLLKMHFSTWPEQPGDTRSDSHAWSAHPIYDLLTIVAGIEPSSPGFRTVRIAPHLGSLPSMEASFPHPQGMIQVSYKRKGAGLDAKIIMPGSLTGTFEWKGVTEALKPGANHFTLQ